MNPIGPCMMRHFTGDPHGYVARSNCQLQTHGKVRLRHVGSILLKRDGNVIYSTVASPATHKRCFKETLCVLIPRLRVGTAEKDVTVFRAVRIACFDHAFDVVITKTRYIAAMFFLMTYMFLSVKTMFLQP